MGNKLTDEQAVAAHSRIKNGDPLKEIAKSYNVTINCISLLGLGKTYKHLNLEAIGKRVSFLSDDKVADIYNFILNGGSYQEAAKKFNVSNRCVYLIARGISYKHLNFKPIQKFRGCGVPVELRMSGRSVFDVATGCLNWIGSKSMNGYGQIKVNGKQIGAHRVAYELAFGEIPQGMSVMHKCDNPSCVNPDHLAIGTPQDNMDDMKNKGRSLYGSKNQSAVLSDSDVIEINKMLSNGSKVIDLMGIYGVSKACINRIRSGKSWKHLK